MTRQLVALFILIQLSGVSNPVHSQVISALAGRADDAVKTVEVEFDGQKVGLREDQIANLTVSAQKTAVPALKYRLYPSMSSLRKGDAATLYHRAILFHRQHRSARNARENRLKKDRGEKVPFSQQTFDELSDLLDKELTDTELSELKKYIDAEGQNMFNEIKLAATLRDCDWGFDVNEGRPLLEYISFLLPEIQEIRSLTRFLALRTKIQIANNDFEGAVETIRVGLKMAKATEDTRFMVCSLVGVACSNVLLHQLESMMGAKDSPNLYWALETLPNPLLSVKTAVIYEIEFLRAGGGLKVFQNPEKQSHSTKQWNQLLIQDMDQLTQLLGSGVSYSKSDDLRKLQSLAIMLRGYPIAKRQLIEWGYDEDKIESMPAVQVLAIHESRMLKIIADEILKCMNLDLKDALARIEAVVGRMPVQVDLGQNKTGRYEELIPLAANLLPAINAVLRAESRVARKIKFFQTVEALRIHAAVHKTLPNSLEEITSVPVPINPDTGRPFIYRKTGDSCVLWEMSPTESKTNPMFPGTRVLKIKLRK